MQYFIILSALFLTVSSTRTFPHARHGKGQKIFGNYPTSVLQTREGGKREPYENSVLRKFIPAERVPIFIIFTFSKSKQWAIRTTDDFVSANNGAINVNKPTY